MLIACQQEEQKEGGTAILSQMEESHYVHIMSDVLLWLPSAKNYELNEKETCCTKFISFELSTCYLAGTDTSKITLTWIVIYMARNPECQRKMQQEIQSLLGKIHHWFSWTFLSFCLPDNMKKNKKYLDKWNPQTTTLKAFQFVSIKTFSEVQEASHFCRKPTSNLGWQEKPALHQCCAAWSHEDETSGSNCCSPQNSPWLFYWYMLFSV